jgi:hypothetical protein
MWTVRSLPDGGPTNTELATGCNQRTASLSMCWILALCEFEETAGVFVPER